MKWRIDINPWKLLWLLPLALVPAVWLYFFEQVEQGQWFTSDAARENPLLAATTLLRQNRLTVANHASLGGLLTEPLPAGTIILAQTDGDIAPQQFEQLMRWVREGNTLILQPRWSGQTRILDEADDAPCRQPAGDAPDSGGDAGGKRNEQRARREQMDAETHQNQLVSGKPDPLAQKYGVVLWKIDNPVVFAPSTNDVLRNGADPAAKTRWRTCLSHLQLGQQSALVRLETNRSVLALPAKGKPAPNLTDEKNLALYLFAEGRGRVVLLARPFFANHDLPWFDHAQLLLQLVALAPPRVMVVQHLDSRSWQARLWASFPLLLVSLLALLLAWFWMRVRRFGIILPDPEPARRALLEHIDASGRWLWHCPGGPQRLLGAMRSLTQKTLKRRAPMLAALPPEQQIEPLLQATRINRTSLDLALLATVARTPQAFSAQIQTLQRVRNHYER